MEIRYFDASWNDIKHSTGWFKKLLQIALVNLVPIFGQIVSNGYMYGWAREIAWGVHEPMPRRLFGNEDGKLYRRGFYILVMLVAISLIVSIIMGIVSTIFGIGITASNSREGVVVGIALTMSGLLSLLGLVLGFATMFFSWVSSMRIAIYDRLSAGFQFGKIWKMMKHDFSGLMRILGMNLIVGLLGSLALSFVLGFLFTVFGVTVGAGLLGIVAGASSEAAAEEALRDYLLAGNLGIIVGGTLLLSLVTAYITLVLTAFIELLTARALGYWTMQFDVPQWRGQDDPMPFENENPAAQVAAVPPYYGAGANPSTGYQPNNYVANNYQQGDYQPNDFQQETPLEDSFEVTPLEEPSFASDLPGVAPSEGVGVEPSPFDASLPAQAEVPPTFEQAQAAAAEAAQNAEAEFSAPSAQEVKPDEE